MYKKDNKPFFEIIQHTEVVRESKSLNIISTEGILIRLFLEFVDEFSTCGEMNGCFGTSALSVSYTHLTLPTKRIV